MMRHMEGTNIDYDIFDNENGRGMQIVEDGNINSSIIKMIDKKVVFGYAKINNMRVRKSALERVLKRTVKGTRKRMYYKVYMEALNYSVADIKCVEREIDKV